MFANKHQYLRLTQLIADTFGMKLAKTRHKISNKLGFKSTQAFEASLPQSGTEARFLKSDSLDQLGWAGLDTYTEFNYYSDSDHTGLLSCFRFRATREIELAFQGYLYSDPKLAAFKVSVAHDSCGSTEDDRVSLEVYKIYPSHLSNLVLNDVFKEHYFISLIQHFEPSYIITDLQYLLDNAELSQDLIEAGSIWQYNFFCENPDLVQQLGLEKHLVKRYMRLLMAFFQKDFVSAFASDEPNFDFLKPAGALSKWNSESEFYHALKTPPVEFAKGRFLFDYFESENEFDLVETLLNGALGAVGDSAVGGVNSAYDRAKLFDKKRGWTSVELTTLRHIQWVIEFLSLSIVDGCYVGECEWSMNWYLEAIIENPLDLQSSYIQEALLKVVPDGQYCHMVFERRFAVGLKFVPEYSMNAMIKEWCGIPLVGYLAFDLAQCMESPNDLCAQHLQYAFSNLGHKLLGTQLNFHEYLDDSDGYADQRTVEELLKHAINLVTKSPKQGE